MSSSMIISSLVIYTIVMTATATTFVIPNDTIVIPIDNDSFYYAFPSQQVKSMAEAQQWCNSLNDHFDELAKLADIDPKKRVVKWADLPHPDTKEKNQRLGEALKEMRSMVSVVRIGSWIGLKRETPTTFVEKQGAGWRDGSKWSWTNPDIIIVNNTLEHLLRWAMHQPDNNRWWTTQKEDEHELCVVASFGATSGEAVWEDQQCEGRGFEEDLRDGMRLVCEVRHMKKPEDKTTSTESETEETTPTGIEMKKVKKIKPPSLVAFGLFWTVVGLLIVLLLVVTGIGIWCFVSRRGKKQEQEPVKAKVDEESSGCDYTGPSLDYRPDSEKMPPKQPGICKRWFGRKGNVSNKSQSIDSRMSNRSSVRNTFNRSVVGKKTETYEDFLKQMSDQSSKMSYPTPMKKKRG